MASSFELLTEDTWIKLKSSTRRHKQIHAAIAYVTQDHISFKKNDVLVCDASDAAIKGGLTDAVTLAKFHAAGAALYSLQGLHAKIAVIDGDTFIGSTNMSANACIRTTEASLFTNNPQIAGLAQSFVVDTINNEHTKIIDEAFLDRIQKIKVSKRMFIIGTPPKNPPPTAPKKKNRSIPSNARAWFLSPTDFSAEEQALGDEVVPDLVERAVKRISAKQNKKLSKVAKHWLSDPENMQYIRFRSNESLAQKISTGDLIVTCSRSPSGKTAKVNAPATCLYTEDDGIYIRICFDYLLGEQQRTWVQTKKELTRLGVNEFTPATQREIKGKALGLLDFLRVKKPPTQKPLRAYPFPM